MTAKKFFNPKGWLLFFAALHTFMFLVPQIFMTSSAVDMVWGEGKAPPIAEFYEYQLGVLGLAYTPILVALALYTAGKLRAKFTIVVGLSMGAVAALNTTKNIQQEGYAEDMVAFMIVMPIIIMGGLLISGWLHLNDDDSTDAVTEA